MSNGSGALHCPLKMLWHSLKKGNTKQNKRQTKGDITESSTITEFEMAQYHRFRAEFWNYEVQLKFNTENN